ncbi:hypothetical protein BJV78DRAFT_907247 [Lactifluus subvellereus]|nr:hypothetical protein BJV78DRAFT_907247 [Lactifluus subvellereus]
MLGLNVDGAINDITVLINFLTGNSTPSKLLRLAVVIKVTLSTARSSRGHALASTTSQNLFGLGVGYQRESTTFATQQAALLVRLLVPTSPPLSATAPGTASPSITISPPSPRQARLPSVALPVPPHHNLVVSVNKRSAPSGLLTGVQATAVAPSLACYRKVLATATGLLMTPTGPIKIRIRCSCTPDRTTLVFLSILS